jgi:hypothetical protein
MSINFKEFNNLTLKFILYGCNHDTPIKNIDDDDR